MNAIEFNLLREVEERKSFGIILLSSWLFSHFVSFSPFIFFISRLHVRKLKLRKVYIWYRHQTGTRVTIQPLSVGFKAGVLTSSSSLYLVVLRLMVL